jgi:hypothetical protein
VFVLKTRVMIPFLQKVILFGTKKRQFFLNILKIITSVPGLLVDFWSYLVKARARFYQLR